MTAALAEPLLERVPLTGLDDQTALQGLRALSLEFPFVEWALLYVLHNEGAARNPTRDWRQAFFDAQLPGFSAVHLCGKQAFEQLLADQLPAELVRAHRLQLNINARKREFSEEQVLEVYRRALGLGPDLILQYHADSAGVIQRFLSELPRSERPRVHVLLDDSRGLGKTPQTWHWPQELGADVFYGFAGGLGPDNIAGVLEQLQQHGVRYWPDMESGLRTLNRFDIGKAQQVLQAAARLRQPAG